MCINHSTAPLKYRLIARISNVFHDQVVFDSKSLDDIDEQIAKIGADDLFKSSHLRVYARRHQVAEAAERWEILVCEGLGVGRGRQEPMIDRVPGRNIDFWSRYHCMKAP